MFDSLAVQFVVLWGGDRPGLVLVPVYLAKPLVCRLKHGVKLH